MVDLVESLPLPSHCLPRVISTANLPSHVVNPFSNPSDILFNAPMTSLSKHDKSKYFDSMEDCKEGILFGIGDFLVRRKAMFDYSKFIGGGVGLAIIGRVKKRKVVANLLADLRVSGGEVIIAFDVVRYI